jgi:hypothetical protein
MSPRSAQRFWDNDMHQNKDLKRVAWNRFSATRFVFTVHVREIGTTLAIGENR